MKVNKKSFVIRPYQEATFPNGSAPVALEYREATLASAAKVAKPKLDVYFIDPDVDESGETKFGLFMVKTGVPLPPDLRVFPERHPLIDKELPANARYVGTQHDYHIFVGNPREKTK